MRAPKSGYVMRRRRPGAGVMALGGQGCERVAFASSAWAPSGHDPGQSAIHAMNAQYF